MHRPFWKMRHDGDKAERDSLPLHRWCKVVCCRRETGGKRMSTGHSHLMVRVPDDINKNTRYLKRYLVLLVRRKGLEHPTY